MIHLNCQIDAEKLQCIYVSCVMALQDAGHLSYACPKNILGDRDPPKKKEKKKKKKGQQPDHVYVF